MKTKGPKMNAEKVLAIRQCARDGVVITHIARSFALGIRATRRILNSETWSNVIDPAGAGPIRYATVTNTKKHKRAVRPVCPTCGGFIEADSNDHKGIFLACENCGRTWSALVTEQERHKAAAISVA